MKFGIAVFFILLLDIPTCRAECTRYLLISCNQKLEQAKAQGISTYSHACRILDQFISCVKDCANEAELRAAAYKRIANYGLTCGSSMVTVSGTWGIFTILVVSKNYFY